MPKDGGFPAFFQSILGRRPVIFGVRSRDGAFFLSYPCLRTSAILDGRDAHASVKSSGETISVHSDDFPRFFLVFGPR